MGLSSTNGDNLAIEASIGACICNCEINIIDIACIQETHNGRNGRQEYKDYTIH